MGAPLAPGQGPAAAPKKKGGCGALGIVLGVVGGVVLLGVIGVGVVVCVATRGSTGGELTLGETEEGFITSRSPERDGRQAIDYTFEADQAGWYQFDLRGEGSWEAFTPVVVVLRDGNELGRALAGRHDPMSTTSTSALATAHLQPGEHTVRVTCANEDGVSERVEFRLTARRSGAGLGGTGPQAGFCGRMTACCQAVGAHSDFQSMCASVPYLQSQPSGEQSCQQQLPALQSLITTRGWQLPLDCQ